MMLSRVSYSFKTLIQIQKNQNYSNKRRSLNLQKIVKDIKNKKLISQDDINFLFPVKIKILPPDLGPSFNNFSTMNTDEYPSYLKQNIEKFSKKKHQITFGQLKINDQEKISLKGTIQFPILFNNQSDENIIKRVNDKCFDYCSKIGLIPNTEESKIKYTESNFARFASYTSVNFDMRGLKSIDDIKGKSKLEKIHWLLFERTAPLEEEELIDQTLFLSFLFPQDSWGEKSDSYFLIKNFYELLIQTFSTGAYEQHTFESIMDDYKLELLSKEGAYQKEAFDNEKKFLNGLLFFSSDLHKRFESKFQNLNNGDPHFIGYNHFFDVVEQYFKASSNEAEDRIKKRFQDEEYFDLERLDFSAVYTVFILSILSSKYRIKQDVLKDHNIKILGVNGNHIICRFNAFISSFSEIETPNWRNNDLYVLSKYRNISYFESCEVLFKKLGADLEKTPDIIERLPDDIDSLLYAAKMMQWTVGSVVAQLTSKRYSENRGEDFIPSKNISRLDINFLEHIYDCE